MAVRIKNTIFTPITNTSLWGNNSRRIKYIVVTVIIIKIVSTPAVPNLWYAETSQAVSKAVSGLVKKSEILTKIYLNVSWPMHEETRI